MFLLTAILYDDTVYFNDYNSVLIRSYWTCSYKLVMQLAMHACTSIHLLARMHGINGCSLPVCKCCKIGNVAHLLIKKPSPTTEGYWAPHFFGATITDIYSSDRCREH